MDTFSHIRVERLVSQKNDLALFGTEQNSMICIGITEARNKDSGTLSCCEDETSQNLRFSESVAERSPSVETEQNKI